jgi:hypothetical protein
MGDDRVQLANLKADNYIIPHYMNRLSHVLLSVYHSLYGMHGGMVMDRRVPYYE